MLKYLLCRKKQIEENQNDKRDWKIFCREMSQHDVTVLSIDTIYSMENLQTLLGHAGFPAKMDEALMLAVNQQEIDWANSLDMAVVGYEMEQKRETWLRTDAQENTLKNVPTIVQNLEGVDFTFCNQSYQRKHKIPWTIFTTERCVVKELTLTDLDELFLLYKKDHVTDYMEPLYEYEEEVAYEKAYIENMYGYYGYGMWLVRNKETNELIGRAGIENREYDGKIELEMGYVIAPDYQRAGYATEICTGIIEWARDNLDFPQINCLVEMENQASIALLNKLSFSMHAKVLENGKEYCRYIFKL